MQTNLETRPEVKRILSKLSVRRLSQAFVVFVMLYAAWQYAGFVDYVKYGWSDSYPERPPVVEGFLPIAAIVAFKAFLHTGIIDSIHPAGLVIFIAILVTAWVFRRALCSWICPIGTLSEHLAKLGRKIFGRNLNVPKWLDYILLGIKYVIFMYIFKLFFLMPAAEAIAFMQIPYYAISDIKMFEMFENLSVKWLAIIGILMALCVVIKSFWCRYLCPYGALVGLLGLVSPIFLVKDESKCTKCTLCNKACPSRVEVQERKKIIVSTECTGCTACVSACPREGALQFKLFGVLPLSTKVFSIGFLGLFFGIIIWAKATGHWESRLSIEEFKNLYTMMSSGFGAGF